MFNKTSIERITAARSLLRSQVVNLYAVNDRRQTIMCIVAAHGSEEAIGFCVAAGLEWELANTVTRRIRRNIDTEPELLSAVELVQRGERFRLNMKSKVDQGVAA